MGNKQNHKEWRRKFNETVLKRDGHKCKFCDCTEDLDVHHITDRKEMPNGGYVPSNGITLCPKHHLMAEVFHIECGNKWEEGFHPDDLYKAIDSSHSKAYTMSLGLK